MKSKQPKNPSPTSQHCPLSIELSLIGDNPTETKSPRCATIYFLIFVSRSMDPAEQRLDARVRVQNYLLQSQL